MGSLGNDLVEVIYIEVYIFVFYDIGDFFCREILVIIGFSFEVYFEMFSVVGFLIIRFLEGLVFGLIRYILFLF